MSFIRSNTRLTPQKYLSDEEAKHLERIIEKFYEKNFRNCLILELALRTGIRAQELLNLKKSDINTEERSLFISTLKGGEDREIPLPTPLFRRLAKHAGVATTERLFPIGYEALRLIWNDFRPVKKKFHALRHTAAIRAYKKTKDLKMVKYLLGHSNIQTTMIYLDYIENKESLRRIL